MGKPFGQAEGGPHLPAGIAVVSGQDPFKDDQTYVNQVFVGYTGGGALNGHDGWLTYCGPANGGLITLDSVEVAESMYPMLIESRGVVPDTQGIGEWEGAPGVGGVYRPLGHAMTVVYSADGTHFPPRGVLGGHDAAGTWSRKVLADGETVELPAFNEELCAAQKKKSFFACGGGGYGDPLKRRPDMVARSVNRGWLSEERAREAYRVALRLDPATDEYLVDVNATRDLRG
jgi:N-methylhydantoinase B